MEIFLYLILILVAFISKYNWETEEDIVVLFVT